MKRKLWRALLYAVSGLTLVFASFSAASAGLTVLITGTLCIIVAFLYLLNVILDTMDRD